MNDPFFISLLADFQNLSTDYEKANGFVTVKLKSLHNDDWDKLFSEEPQLEMYRPYLVANYMRFTEHRPINESQDAYLADIENQRMRIQTEAGSEIRITSRWQGNITLENREKCPVNLQSYNTLLGQRTTARTEKGVITEILPYDK